MSLKVSHRKFILFILFLALTICVGFIYSIFFSPKFTLNCENINLVFGESDACGLKENIADNSLFSVTGSINKIYSQNKNSYLELITKDSNSKNINLKIIIPSDPAPLGLGFIKVEKNQPNEIIYRNTDYKNLMQNLSSTKFVQVKFINPKDHQLTTFQKSSKNFNSSKCFKVNSSLLKYLKDSNLINYISYISNTISTQCQPISIQYLISK